MFGRMKENQGEKKRQETKHIKANKNKLNLECVKNHQSNFDIKAYCKSL